jgi:hypothetical protein
VKRKERPNPQFHEVAPRSLQGRKKKRRRLASDMKFHSTVLHYLALAALSVDALRASVGCGQASPVKLGKTTKQVLI